jgi:hypothetical protein
MRGKNVCRTHGGLSTGPRTEEGRKRCAAAKTVHGRETKAKRAEYRAKMKELRELEEQARTMGMIVEERPARRKSK